MERLTELTGLLDRTDHDGDYSQSDLVDALNKIGISAGDVVYAVVNLAALGNAKDCSTAEDQYRCLLGALQEAVGKSGTILVPTYTFSFCRREIFDVQSTPSINGPWSPSTGFLEYFRQQPGAIRSVDPIHSVAGIGPRAAEILTNVPATCFGDDSVPDRLRRMGAKICTIGVGLHESNFQHHVEEMHGVPFRFKKLFTGQIRNHGVTEKKGWVYNVGILAKNGRLDEHRLEKNAREAGLCQAAAVGRGELLGIDCRKLFDFTFQTLTKDPWITAEGPAGDPVELERLRVAAPRHKVDLPPSASTSELIQALWKLPRDIVSRDTIPRLRHSAPKYR